VTETVPGREPSPAGQPPNSGPIFVVGSMRSGSTLLRLILDSHPRIAVSPETGFMGAVMAAKVIPNWRHGGDWYRRLDWTEDELDCRLREFYGGMFERYASGQGKRRWGEKTPFHTSFMPTMAKIFPDAVFVGIVRHPGAVAASLRKNFHYTFPAAVSYWTATNLDMVRAGTTLGTRFVACRYEDLLQDGEAVLRELMNFLGEPWESAVLEHHRVQRDKGAPRVADGSTITSDPIDARRAERWITSTNSDDLEALNGVHGLAGFFGYDPSDPVPREPLLDPGGPRRWLPTGEDLRRRRLDWEDRVDFELRPPSLALDATPAELAERLHRAEEALARVRTRKSVRVGDAFRIAQHGRSWRAYKEAWSVLQGNARA
jgi:Sulfotransferase family